MKNTTFLLSLLLLLLTHSACEKKTALEKAVPWDVSSITPQIHTSQRPGIQGYQYKVYVLEEGSGPLITHGQYVCYRFNAFLENGTAFDTTIDADPLCFIVDNNSLPVRGLEEGIMLMRKGAKYRFVFPPELAFGESVAYNGLVPPSSSVMYDIEVVSVTN